MGVEELPETEPVEGEVDLRGLPDDLRERVLRERETARRLASYLAQHHPTQHHPGAP